MQVKLFRASALTASVWFRLVHVRQQRSAGQLGHSSDDFHPPALQRGFSDDHLQLQELGGLQGRKDRQPEESCDPQGLQRSGTQSRGKQPLQIHGGGGHLLSKFLLFNFKFNVNMTTTNIWFQTRPRLYCDQHSLGWEFRQWALSCFKFQIKAKHSCAKPRTELCLDKINIYVALICKWLLVVLPPCGQNNWVHHLHGYLKTVCEATFKNWMFIILLCLIYNDSNFF